MAKAAAYQVSTYEVIRLLPLRRYAVVKLWPTGRITCIRLERKLYEKLLKRADEGGYLDKASIDSDNCSLFF